MRGRVVGQAVRLLAAVGFVAAVSPICGGQQTTATANQSLAHNPPVQVRKAAADKSGVIFREGRLSVNVQGRSMQRLAAEISAQVGIPVMFSGNMPQDFVSINLRNTPLEEGLRQIFVNYDSFFFYGVEEHGAPSRLMSVWVYPKGVGRGLVPVPADQWASTKELHAMLSDKKDPTVRGQAIEALAERKGQAAATLVLDSLKDADDQVRTRALYGALKTGITLPEDVLSSATLNDSSADVRLLAPQALANTTSGPAIAASALNDLAAAGTSTVPGTGGVLAYTKSVVVPLMTERRLFPRPPPAVGSCSWLWN